MWRSHKGRNPMPNVAAMLRAAKNEADNLSIQFSQTQEDYSGNTANPERLLYILSDINIALGTSCKVPIMRSEEYRSIVDATTIVSKTDTNGKILYVNKLFCDISEYSQEELIGKTHNIIRHPDIPDEFYDAIWKRICVDKKVWKGEIKNLSKSKREYWVDTVIVPQLDESNEVVGYVAFRNEITEKVKQRELVGHEQQLNQIILDGQSGLVAIVSKAGKLIKANNAFFQAFNFESCNVDAVDRFNAKYKSISEALNDDKVLSSKDVSRKIVLVLNNERKIFSLSVKTSSFFEKRYIISMYDVTESEEDIENAKRESFAKSNFLATMSHEIRTPINGISGFVELLSQTNLNEQQSGYIEIVKRSTQTLLGVINDILDLSKIESGNFEIENIDFNLTKELENISDLFIAKANEKNIDLYLYIDPAIPKCVKGDALRLKQIIANLLGNAIKFTSSNGHINIYSEIKKQDSKKLTLRISVSDDGIGMSEDTQKLIFTPFTQADNSISRTYGGTGLGLSICQSFAKLMGTEIHLMSEYGNGSEFWFDIELDICDSENYSDKAKKNNKRIALYVADNSQERHIFIAKRYLDAFGFNYIVIDSIENGNIDDYDILMVFSSGNDSISQIDAEFTQNHRIVTIVPSGVQNKNKFFSHKNINMPVNGSKLFDAIIENKNSFGELEKGTQNPTEKKNYNARVLVAEDNSTNQKLILHLLGTYGISPDIANNGAEAYLLYRESCENNSCYDLIFMDMHMPILDGIKATKKIRIYEKKFNILRVPIIALTADVIKGQDKKYHDAGMDSLLAKPIDFSKFDEKLAENLSQLQSTAEQLNNSKNEQAEIKEVGEQDVSHFIIERSAEVSRQLEIDLETATMLVEDFYENWQMQSKELGVAIHSNDLGEIRAIAHSIKGAAGSLRLDDIYNATMGMEHAARDIAGYDFVAEFGVLQRLFA